jgi:hypothetical protein
LSGKNKNDESEIGDDVNAVTIEQLKCTLPNGFHDAELFSVRIDYERGVCILGLEVDLDSSGARVELILTGLVYCEVQVPDASYPFAGTGSVEVSGCETTEQVLQSFGNLRRLSPPETFFYSFFVKTWNSFIHVAAKSAELRWIEGTVSEFPERPPK